MNLKNDSNIKPIYDISQRNSMGSKRHKKGHRKNIIIVSIFIATIILAALVLIALPKFHSASYDIRGIWIYDQYTYYEFDGQGNGCLQLETERYEYTYKILGTKLYIDFANVEIRDCTYDFSIQNDELLITGKEGTIGGQYKLIKNS